jgi:DNA-binding PadR family transcriptional regulator
MSMLIGSKVDMPKRSPLGLLVLWYLVGEPMHAYRMQKLIEAQGKHRVVNVRSPASLYQTIKRLEHHGLIKIKETVRDSNQRDRTVYAVTDAGRQAAREWLHAFLLETGGEYPQFLAAVSIMFALPPDEARELLEERAARLGADLAQAEAELAASTGLPRLFLLEEEYRRAALQAELAWVRAVCAELRSGQLSWDDSSIRAVGARFNPPTDEQ